MGTRCGSPAGRCRRSDRPGDSVVDHGERSIDVSVGLRTARDNDVGRYHVVVAERRLQHRIRLYGLSELRQVLVLGEALLSDSVFVSEPFDHPIPRAEMA